MKAEKIVLVKKNSWFSKTKRAKYVLFYFLFTDLEKKDKQLK